MAAKRNNILKNYIGSMAGAQAGFQQPIDTGIATTVTLRVEDLPRHNDGINENWQHAQGYNPDRKTTTMFAKEIEERLSKIEKALYAKKIMFKDAANEGLDFYGSNEWRNVFDALNLSYDDNTIATLSQFYEPPVKKSL